MSDSAAPHLSQLLDQAISRHQAGDLAGAERGYRQVLAASPGHPDALHLLGMIAHQAGDNEGALELIDQAIAIRPLASTYHGNRGIVLLAAGRARDAEASLREAVELKHDDAIAHFHLGNTLATLGNFNGAVASLRLAVEHAPDNAPARTNLALACRSAGRFDEAIEAYGEAIRLDPVSAELHAGHGFVLHRRGRLDQAVAAYREALRLEPMHPMVAETWVNLANALRDSGALDEAIAAYETALAMRPGLNQALAGQADIHERKRDFAAARALLVPLVEAGNASPAIALAYGRLAERFGEREQAVALIERILKEGGLLAQQQQLLHFALGKLYDDGEAWDMAFAHFQTANDLFETSYDPWDQSRAFAGLIAAFARDTMAALPRAGVASTLPVFIVGMPRSGTTLVEQILASHPEVTGGGELTDISDIANSLPGRLGTEEDYPDCISGLTQAVVDECARRCLGRLAAIGGGATRVTDKTPLNFSHLGLIALLFPGAGVIHTTRDSRDTCLSCYFQNFGERHGYSRHLAHLGTFHNDYRRIMAHWRETLDVPILGVAYEDLVREPERVSREIVDFCGLPWDEACLRFFDNPRFVGTASYDQVRRPIYTASLERWRHYSRHLEPLLAALGGDG